MSRAARAKEAAPPPVKRHGAVVLLGEETLSEEQIADELRQEAARTILSRRSHAAAKVVDSLRLLVDQATDPDELAAWVRALGAARAGRDLVVKTFNAARPR